MSKKKIALYGFGTVGKGFYQIYQDKKSPEFEIIGIIVKNSAKHSPVEVPIYQYGTKEEQTLFSQADIIIECTSNYAEGRDIVLSALKNGKTVISASKKVLAENLNLILEIQKKHNAKLFYEAAAAASIPVFKILHQHFSHENIRYFKGILNGTCNFILTKMESEGLSYPKALLQAQQLGYAEADPFSDVSGWDTAYKLVLLTYSASGVLLNPHELFIEGIENITFQDIYLAKNNGLRIKLLAHADIEKSIFFVCPAFVSNELAGIDEAWNAIRIEYEYAKSQFYTGRGAGREATGSAIWGDLNVSQNIEKIPQKTTLHIQQAEYYGYWFIRLNTTTLPLDFISCNTTEVLTYNKTQNYYIVHASLSGLRELKNKIKNAQIIQISDENTLKIFTKQTASYSFQF